MPFLLSTNLFRHIAKQIFRAALKAAKLEVIIISDKISSKNHIQWQMKCLTTFKIWRSWKTKKSA